MKDHSTKEDQTIIFILSDGQSLPVNRDVSVKYFQVLFTTQLHRGSLAEQGWKKEWLAPVCASDGDARLCFRGVGHMGWEEKEEP